jgi:hypothetical protein
MYKLKYYFKANRIPVYVGSAQLLLYHMQCSSDNFFQGGITNPLHAKKCFSKDLNRRKNFIF